MNKEVITKKLEYYQKQRTSALERFLRSNTRLDRDSVIKVTERIKVYEEVLSIKA